MLDSCKEQGEVSTVPLEVLWAGDVHSYKQSPLRGMITGLFLWKFFFTSIFLKKNALGIQFFTI